MAAITLTVRDETTSGELLGALELQLEAEEVTVAELIRARVHQEVRAHAAAAPAPFRGLVRPTEEERARNGARPARRRPIDPEKQTAIAQEAFGRGHVLLLVDDRQVTELHHRVVLTPGSTVTFLKLTPLVGG